MFTLIDWDTLRTVSGWVGIVAFGGLCFRLASTWDMLSRLGHVLAVLLGGSILLGAIGALALADAALVDTKALQAVSFGLFLHRVGVVVTVIAWGRLLARRPPNGPLAPPQA